MRPLDSSLTPPETPQNLLSIQGFLRYRGTSKALAAAAGLLVKHLRCETACDITSGAWIPFSNAAGLVLLTSDAKEHERERAAFFGPMLARAPANRIKRFVLVGRTSLWAGTVAHTLVAQPTVRSLEHVNMGDGPLTATEADGILRGLPELQTLKAKVMRSMAGPWSPAIASAGKLINLHLAGPAAGTSLPGLVLDDSGLAGGELKELRLEGIALVNWASIAGAEALVLLSLRNYDLQQLPGTSLQQALLQPLEHLQALETLNLPDTDIGSADWKLLARCEILRKLTVNHVVGDCSPEGPSSKIRSLKCRGLALPAPTLGASNRGMLARLLPQLQAIACGYTLFQTCCLCSELAEALAEHPELRCFQFNDDIRGSASLHQARYHWHITRPDSPAPFQTMPALDAIDISNCCCTNHNQLVVDVARCAKLQRVLLQWAPCVLRSQPNVLLMAGGLASRSMRSLVIDVADTVVDVGQVASMLSRQAFPALEVLTVQGVAQIERGVQLSATMQLGKWLLGQLMAELLERAPAVQVSKQPPKAVGAASGMGGVPRASLRLVVDGIAFEMLAALPAAEDEHNSSDVEDVEESEEEDSEDSQGEDEDEEDW